MQASLHWLGTEMPRQLDRNMGAIQYVHNIKELCDLNLSLLEGWLENIFLTLGHGAVHIGADVADHLEKSCILKI